MRKLAFLILALVLVSAFFVFRPLQDRGLASSAEALPPSKPQFVRAIASGVSPRLSDLSAKSEDRTPKTTAKGTLIRPSEQNVEGFAQGEHDTDAAPAATSLLPMPATTLSFDGIFNTQNGQTYGLFFIPSDTNGDVGQNHYMQATNALLRIYDKSGTPVTSALRISDIFAPLGTLCATRNDAQPVVLYDTLADRWLLSQYCQAFTPFRQMVAISKTGDPTGAWNLYEFVMPNFKLNDYAKFGVWPDGYYMSTDEFVGDEYRGNGIFAFDRQKMLSGDPTAGYIYFNMPSAGIARLGNFLPADLDGYNPPPPGAPNTFMGYTATEYGAAQDALRLFDFHADFQTPSNSTFTERAESPLAVAAFDPTSPAGRGDIDVPAPGENLDAQSDRLMYRVAYRNFGTHESLVVNQTVRMTPVELPYRAGVRLYELRRTGGAFSVHEQATLSDPVSSLWMGGAAQDHQGNIAAEYSIANASKHPSVEYAGRLASEPAGTFRTPGVLVAGTGVQTAFGFRWGDYSGMTVDPVDDCTFWMTNQYYSAESQAESPFSWLTKVGKFKFDECTPVPRATITGTVTDSMSGQPIAGARVTASAYRRDANAAGSYGNMLVLPGGYMLTASAPGYRPQSFNLNIANGQTLTQNFQLQPVPVLSSASTSITAESCTPNQAPDPGETLTVNVTLVNTGVANTQNLDVTLFPSGGVINPGDSQVYGALVANGPGVTRPFTFRVGPSVGCGGTIIMRLNLSDGPTSLGSVLIPLQVGTPKNAFSENFDRVTRPNLPVGWSTSATGAQQIWTTTNARSESNPNSLFSPDPNQVGLNEVTTPSFAVTSPNAKVSFRNWYEMETTFLRNRLWDGAVMEIRIDDGDWRDILAAGGVFETGGYDGMLDACCMNPLGGRLGWSGRSGPNLTAEFITSRAKLPAAAAGQNVRLRWRVGTDNGTFREGMYIDDLAVTDGFTCACGAFAPKRAPFDFDGDGKTDLSVFHPTDTPGAPDFSLRNSSNINVVQNTPWGSVGDRAAIADFDGDGKADIAVFRPSEGNWYALRSSDSAVIALHFGLNGDKPVPADYDGDGKADIAVFRPSDGNWYYLRSSDGQFFGGHWGATGDIPVQEDYDNDGKNDLAVFRPADGAWYILGSTQGFFAQHFGLGSDRPVAGDYDGDGRSDFTVFRPSDGIWYLLRSTSGFQAMPFGLGSDLPIQVDMDGDGVRDIAVHRADNSAWFHLRSSDGNFNAGNFGSASDTPLPSIYVNP